MGTGRLTVANVLVPNFCERADVTCEPQACGNQSRKLTAVLLPTYCEAENIGSLIEEIQKLNLEIVIAVVDDSSPDDTSGVVRGLQKKYGNISLISRSSKLGLGTAIVAGFRFFLGLAEPPDYIISMDSDYSHNPQDIVRLVNCAVRGSDLVIGSRYVKNGKYENWPFRRQLISRVANVIAGLVVDRRIRDCTSGFRCYSRDYVQKVLPTLHSTTYEIQIETLRQGKFRHFRVQEIPITFLGRKKGKSKLSRDEIRVFLNYIATCLLPSWHRRNGENNR
jgi:dolichol-phosphate mannosyltransferase